MSSQKISKLLDKIEKAENVKQRDEFLDDFKQLLSYRRNNPELNNVEGNTHSDLLDSLFDCHDKVFDRYKKAPTRHTPKPGSKRGTTVKDKKLDSLTRLAAAINLTLESCIRQIEIKTVKVVIIFILDVLENLEDHSEQLRVDFHKCLRLVLSYPPHVEHLPKNIWNTILEYCLDGISSFQHRSVSGSSFHHTGTTSGARGTPDPSAESTPRSSFMRDSSNIDRHSSGSSGSIAMNELVYCVRYLTSATNAPLFDKAYQRILFVLIEWLQAPRGIIGAYVEAFTAINHIISRISLDFGAVAQQAIKSLIPIIRNSWSSRLSLLKEELLITLIHSKAHIASMLHMVADDADELRFDLESLLDTMQAEYGKRPDREQLQVDDLRLRFRVDCPFEQSPFHMALCRLRPGNTKSEHPWILVHLISYFSVLLDSTRAPAVADNSFLQDGEETPSKKQRTMQYLQDYLRQLMNPHSTSKVCASQIVTFMVHQTPLDVESLEFALDKLTTQVSDGNAAVSNWAMLAIASCAIQMSSASSKLRSQWATVWQLVSRNINAISTCRVAAHAMDVLLRLNLVDYSLTVETMDAMISSVELHGPAVLSETTSSLWITILDMKNSESPHTSNVTADRMFRWLTSKWTPSNFHEKSYTLQNSHHCDAWDVVRVLFTCADRETPLFQGNPFSSFGPLAIAWMQAHKWPGLTNYLLLLEEDGGYLAEPQTSTEVVSNLQQQRSARADKLILDYCSSELEKTIQRFTEWGAERSNSFTTEMLRSITTLCIVASHLSTGTFAIPGARKNDIQQNNSALIKMLAGFVAKPDTDLLSVDAVLEVVASCLPAISTLESFDAELFDNIAITPLILHLAQALHDRRSNKDAHRPTGPYDPMEIDDGFESQRSNSVLKHNTDELPRASIAAEVNILSLRGMTSATILLLSSAFESLPVNGVITNIPHTFLEHMRSLPAAEFLACRKLLVDVLSSPLCLTIEDADDVLVYVANEFLQAYEYERNEVAIGLCVEIMTSTASLWLPKNSRLHDVGLDIYEWLLRLFGKTGTTSSEILIRVVDLFQELLRIQPEYAQDSGIPSVRTELVDVLDKGDIPIKYHIIDRLPKIFEMFVLSEHEAFFGIIFENLPKDDTWKEGMALRLYAFATLGSAWHTLLRLCVYHTFEQVGLVKATERHATRCMLSISRALQLEDPQTLFRLYVPQFLYTWLCKEQIKNIPYRTFGYESLAELLEDVQDEVYGQLAMRGDSNRISDLLAYLQVTEEILLTKTFAKATAYTIAEDTRTQSKGDKPTKSNEARLRELMQEKYLELVRKQFPCILGLLIYSMEAPERVEKPLSKEKDSKFTSVGHALKDIQSISSSKATLPADQQPSFNAVHIFDEIRRLTRRVGYEHPNGFWGPDCFTYVLRLLLSKIHSALGSLHACSVIRKIRFLISLAGPVAFDGYPLQMTLSALRPFLTDSQCADDTLGIVQYLFDHGKPYLIHQLPYVAGISLSILISLRVFLSSSQDSTTQESQHFATLDKAKSFHSWFAAYLLSYTDTLLQMAPNRSSKASLGLFQTMIHAACEVRTEGNAIRGSPESKLLYALLEDDRNGRRLLDGPSQNLAYSLLCHQFHAPPSFREDILGSSDDATKFSTQVWKSSRRTDNSEEYLLWTARALGRGYSASGNISGSLRRAAQGKNISDRFEEASFRTSRMLILEHLANLLRGGSLHEGGIAEEALRTFLSKRDGSRDGPDEFSEAEQVLPEPLIYGLALQDPFDIPFTQPPLFKSIQDNAFPSRHKEFRHWISDLCIALAQSAADDRVACVLPKFLLGIKSSGEVLFPYLLHIALERDFEGQQSVKSTMSEAFRKWFSGCDDDKILYVKVLLQSLLYLRTQPMPKESTIADRTQWLDIDWLEASNAAVKCGMYRAALLLAEIHGKQPARASRRSSVMPQEQSIPLQLQLSIYKNLDEPDYFYGAEQEPSLTSVLNRLDYEAEGFKGLLFRGARMDSQMRRLNNVLPSDSRGIIKDLTMLNLNSLTQALLSNDNFRDTGNSINNTLEVARKLEQWDIRAPSTKTSEAASIYKAFQGLHNAVDLQTVRKHLDLSFLETMKVCSGLKTSTQTLQASFRTLAILNDIDEIMSSKNAEQLYETWDRFRDRGAWMNDGRFEDVRSILSSRETLFSLLSRSPQLQEIIHTGPKDLRSLEVKQLVDVCSTCRKHGALQESLATATYLADMIEPCREVGLNIAVVAEFETASVLWDQGETTTSIRMLQRLEEDVKPGEAGVERSVLLATLGHHVGEARLEKPDEIMKHYMEPAIRELKSQQTGRQAGQVFHQFAAFCDKQLQSQETIDDMNRMKQLAERKEAEAQEYDKMAKSARNTAARDHYKQNARRSRKWYDMDMKESQRIADSRVAFLRQSLENYLLCLQACNDYDNDVFRMFALWFEFADLGLANTAVSKHIEHIASGKFVPLMNQLSSRLQAEKSNFQQILTRLVYRICIDHPYHGMHHIFSGHLGTPKDDGAKSRNTAAKELAKQLKADKKASLYWDRIKNSNMCYHDLANASDSDFRAGRSLPMENYAASKKLTMQIPGHRVPPITLQIDVRHDMNYKTVPRIASFLPRMGIANGLSTPKIVTAVGTDGRQYKQLYKSGNDDLRQDAIMEQVFEHVSQLLQNHTVTRLRNLRIRTYRVIPLSNRSGVIEFVQNTMAVMSYLDNAHQTYNPRDWKQAACREKIASAAAHSTEERLKSYQNVCRHFSPVLRYFFLERFQDPDEWFEKRLAYTRSTAAISILGHVLGLGDRHCHNILLDEKSGESIHIDLGVAFEAGRVLPVPEVVPFRLTRDIVDAMGYTGVEGVFRRCCEFTMETLRNEKDSIMTILNVLRYDPLYSWSLSPLKAKKMQEEQGQNKKFEQDGEKELEELQSMGAKKKEDEVGEAARALSVVERKLSKALSSSAAVSELIQQATDERNLAVLYCGWSAWC
ncbi:uncharacterized protein K452DRAFT_320941 [Aplosporella prunicola CBS 121167]|uniref:Serine/threonine-protein kinase Tel1 n=1 Tax=Aplosporella prunicola CBS 121167 TaxID=1176127 RepID=A0A6A6B4Q8_9PEZI|nr:uncharacterized protein K452DRAFT_320941 [Aplosporella prunicola CBS 121167]KAF2138836.1 hypothetical protein K452DRAFT_320941 [Aplosporella prunicola CBS 121167]